MRKEYDKDKYNFLPRESLELYPTFKVDGKAFTLAQYDKRTPGLFKVETEKNKMISLCSKMYCAAKDTDYCDCCSCKNIECKCNFKFSCKGIQNQEKYKLYKIHDVLLIIIRYS